MGQPVSFSNPKLKNTILPLGIITAVGFGWLTAHLGFMIPGILVMLFLSCGFMVMVFRDPKAGYISTLIFCFTYVLLIREIGDIPFGVGVEILLVITWLGVLFNSSRFNWDNIKNDLCFIVFLWFLVNLLELLHPEDVSFRGWIQEVRSSSIVLMLIIPLCLLLLDKNKDLNLFITFVIALSVLGALNGIRQAELFLTPGEENYLAGPAAKTHLIWGELRAFSFYSDAGQFGASQAHIALVALVLALGPFKLWKRVLLVIMACVLLYGMLVSGTRGALFVLLIGGFTALLLMKHIRLIILGLLAMLSLLFVLKFTFIGESNYEIRRLRSALNPNDASLNVRFENQKIIADYLKTRPLGGGVGVSGKWGLEFNSDKFLSTIPPDSYWVKVWIMYGIVGFILWFGMMMFITGKCCGIVWNIRDERLRFKLIALTAGSTGILFASYGNEVINMNPTSIIVYSSWAFIFMGPKLDNKILNQESND